MAGPPDDGDRVAVGRISGPWGLRGHVRVTPLTSNPQRFQAGAVLLVDGEPRRVTDVATPKGYPCVQFEGCSDRTAAEGLRGGLIEIHGAELPALPAGEYYIHDLVGLAVFTRDGVEVGTVHQVLRTGASDVYVVRREGQKDAIVPAVGEIVVAVDVAARRMVIEPPAGLL